ncbi:MGMT family protein [Chitinophaga cymbidii]|uniref:Methylated-DNA-[protein]-cysteine S-methyltransferase DNA binding domain-containing protein n=1 Tax=Chitinophaga cymbidii TaxID=1096750 RepID=A0A512RGQ0_9BACT|nr:MGMT family protein [Chitinophaga cymbidii]GEP94858.1 hypothetical protein CCY01nite_11180 [Chitinophaga cymbidii]
MRTSPKIKKAASAKPAAKGKTAKAAVSKTIPPVKRKTADGKSAATKKSAAAKSPKVAAAKPAAHGKSPKAAVIKTAAPSTSKPGKKAAVKKAAEPKPLTFLDTVYRIVRQVPRGRVTSYGAIAESAGIRLSARMVGWAMNAAGRANPPVPAHRVVNSKGLLSGKNHFATPTLMQELLENEGITVHNDQVQNFPTVFWDPQELQGKGKAKKKK